MRYENEHDRENAREVAAVLEAEWNCRLRPFAPFTAVDYWAERAGEMFAVVEIKARTCTRDAFPTTWLPLRKHLALTNAAALYDVRAVYAVRFVDGRVCYVDLVDVDGRAREVVYQRHIRDARDIEPVVCIPTELLIEARAHADR